jgi:glycosyltransferase involved in cell wall biosynthesis
VKLAIVVQRYGADINGGAELHARYIAEHLRPHARVEVLTTCARDYVTWRNDLPAGTDEVNGVPVRRFRVRRERDAEDFGRRSRKVFERHHSVASELAWLTSEGPTSPELVEHIRAHADQIDYFIFFSYRYYHSYHGIRAVSAQSLLVPTAERDPAIGVAAFGPVFRATRALMYNSFEERAMIQAVSGNAKVPGVVVGVGSEVPARTNAARFRQKFGISGPFVIYVGRIDENKGCNELFEHFQRFDAAERKGLTLVLVGNSILRVPDHPRIRYLGFLNDDDKFDAMAAARVLIMPSYFESLSMVALEAWGLGRAVLANGRCDVLKGQCIRSNAGLYYDDYDEFAATLRTLTTNRSLNEALGRNGRHYFRQHYAWPVIERKYLDMLNLLRQEDAAGVPRQALEPLPGWIARHRRTLPPSREIMAALPSGPSLSGLDRPAQRRRAPRRPSPARTSSV